MKLDEADREWLIGIIGSEDKSNEVIEWIESRIFIQKYYIYLDDEETKKYYDIDSIREEYEMEIEELEEHNKEVEE